MRGRLGFGKFIRRQNIENSLRSGKHKLQRKTVLILSARKGNWRKKAQANVG